MTFAHLHSGLSALTPNPDRKEGDISRGAPK
jgi:hypothetical protein